MIKKFLLLIGVFFAISFAFVSCKPVNVLADNTPVVKSIKNVRKVQGNVSNLTGTTWVWDDFSPFGGFFSPGSFGFLEYNINFTSNGFNYNKLQINWDNAESDYFIQYMNTNDSSHDDTAYYYDRFTLSVYKTITITGGTDSTNSSLINRLDSYATLQVVDDPPYLEVNINAEVSNPIFTTSSLSLTDSDTFRFYFYPDGLRYRVNAGTLTTITTDYTFPSYFLSTSDGYDYMSLVEWNGNNSYQYIEVDFSSDYESEWYIFENQLISDMLDDSYTEGLRDNPNASDLWLTNNPLRAVLTMVSDFFDIEIFPGFKLYFVWATAFGILLLAIVIKLWVH